MYEFFHEKRRKKPPFACNYAWEIDSGGTMYSLFFYGRKRKSPKEKPQLISDVPAGGDKWSA